MVTHSLMMVLVLSCFCGLISAADLPPAAQTMLDKANADMAKVRQGLIRDLSKAQETATKKGDLDGALAIKAEIEKQSKEVNATADLLAPANPIVGKWSRNNKVWEFKADGTVVESRDETVLSTGTWKLNGKQVQAVLAGNWNITVFLKDKPADTLDIETSGPGVSGAKSTITRK